MKAFEIKVGGKVLDYRVGKNLNLSEVKNFFSKNYSVKEIRQEKRHVIGILEKNRKNLLLKLSPTEGISAVTQIEYKWNEEFNNSVSRKTGFWVPKNIDSGFYKENLFYLITDYFEGEPLAKRLQKNYAHKIFEDNIKNIIKLSEVIQNLQISELSEKDFEEYRQWFLAKTISWFEGIPQEIAEKFEAEQLLNIVKNGHLILKKRVRHGDFSPWHMFNLNGKIGLIDGEHAMKNSVEYYDVAYLIQRVYNVLENPEFAKKILVMLLERNYNIEKLRILLAARAIGGFLDESLKENPNYSIASDFKKWVTDLI